MQPPPITLSLWRHRLGKVPESVWQRTELEVVILADNGLTDLPSRIGRLHRLTTLDLGHNELTSLPDSLGDLVELSGCLYLHDKNLSRLPDSLGSSISSVIRPTVSGRATRGFRRHRDSAAASGWHLDLRENALDEVPEPVMCLPRLRQLDLRSNRIVQLPGWVVRMPALEKLDLRWNPCLPSPQLLSELEQRGCVVLL